MTVTQAVSILDAGVPVLDLRSAEYAADPHAVIRELRSKGPVVRSERGFELIRYDWVTAFVNHPSLDRPHADHFEATGASPVVVAFVRDGLLVDMLRERHDPIRRVLNKAFNHRSVGQHREVMHEVANRLIDGFLEAGSFNAVADFTHRYSIEVLCRLIGVPPEDIPRFERATLEVRHVTGGIEPGREQIVDDALMTLHDYVRDMLHLRRTRPGPDLVSAIIEAQETEGKMTEPEVVWNITNLLFAGHDTTRYQLASAMLALVQDAPGSWDRLAVQPELIPQAVDEAMRFYPAAQNQPRIVYEDVEHRGYLFPKGTMVRLNELGASRDPDVFPDPDRFDIDRERRWDMGFGRGLHYCLGSNLARQEMAEALGILTTRLRDVELDGPVVMLPAVSAMGGPDSVPLRFRPR